MPISSFFVKLITIYNYYGILNNISSIIPLVGLNSYKSYTTNYVEFKDLFTSNFVAFQALYVNIMLFDSMPQAALGDPQQLGRPHLDPTCFS